MFTDGTVKETIKQLMVGYLSRQFDYFAKMGSRIIPSKAGDGNLLLISQALLVYYILNSKYLSFVF